MAKDPLVESVLPFIIKSTLKGSLQLQNGFLILTTELLFPRYQDLVICLLSSAMLKTNPQHALIIVTV